MSRQPRKQAPSGRAALWEAASVRSGTAIIRAGVATGIAVAAGGAAGWLVSPAWGTSIWVGGAVVGAAMTSSTATLAAAARRLLPALALPTALLLYLSAIVSLYLVAVRGRAYAGAAGPLRSAGVVIGALGAAAVWTAALVAVQLRASRPRGPVGDAASGAGPKP